MASRVKLDDPLDKEIQYIMNSWKSYGMKNIKKPPKKVLSPPHYIEIEHDDFLRKVSEDTGESMAELIRQAISLWIANTQKQAPKYNTNQ